MVITDIKNRLYLENTRVIFDFMQELSNLCTNLAEPITIDWKYKGYIGEHSLAGREKIFQDLLRTNSSEQRTVKYLIESCYSGAELLRQNPLSSYINFYREVFGVEDKEINKVTEMLNYFNILRYLTEPEYKEKRHEGFDSLPYIFEDMCLSIKNMTGAESCYLVYKKEGESSQLISRSGYVVDNNSEYICLNGEKDRFSSLNIGATEFDLLIKKSYDRIERNQSGDIKFKIDGVSVIESRQKHTTKEVPDTHKFMLLDIPYQVGEKSEINNFSTENKNQDKKERHFYVILELTDNSITDDALIKIAIRVLFLRNRLLEALKKYYASIINFRFYCNYIQPLVDRKDKVQILHLTDLHLYDDDSWSVKSNNLKLLKEQLISVTKDSKIDLIAVTGDIVNASEDAATAQRKYKRVAILLFEIAKTLWGESKGTEFILPHDWKRRILITTGNHDYAAMNDVRAQTESRKITTGLPARSAGGTMAKYTYFLEFLSFFLDAPTQKLLDSDLNEIREYDHLGLIVGIFNTCSQANALQNNKVSFDSEQLKLVLDRSNWEKSPLTHIALAHHYPSYFMDYFDDKYKFWSENDRTKRIYRVFEELYCDFKKAICFMARKCKRGDAFKKINLPVTYDFLSNYESFQKNSIISTNDKRDKRIIFESQLYNDMDLLYDVLKAKNRHPQEYINQFLSDTSSLYITIRQDKKRFVQDWKKIIKDNNLTILAGHTHKATCYIRADYCAFIGHRFYNGKSDTAPIVFEVLYKDGANYKIKKYVKCSGYEKCNEQHICKISSCDNTSWLCDAVNERNINIILETF